MLKYIKLINYSILVLCIKNTPLWLFTDVSFNTQDQNKVIYEFRILEL